MTQENRKTYEDLMKKREEERRKLKAELEQLLASTPVEDLTKRFCRDFGCINFRDEAFYHELSLARMYHNMLHEADPSHRIVETEPYRCYHKQSCTKCGFSEACDSSD